MGTCKLLAEGNPVPSHRYLKERDKREEPNLGDHHHYPCLGGLSKEKTKFHTTGNKVGLIPEGRML